MPRSPRLMVATAALAASAVLMVFGSVAPTSENSTPATADGRETQSAPLLHTVGTDGGTTQAMALENDSSTTIMWAMRYLHSVGVAVPAVMLTNAAPPVLDAAGLACAPAFETIVTGSQSSCPPGYEGMLVYSGRVGGDLPLAIHVVAHETAHLMHQVKYTDADPFNERAATQYACSITPIRACDTWQRQYGW